MKIYGGDYLDRDALEALGFASLGREVLIHSTCVLVGIEHISIGNHVRIDPFCTLVAGKGHIQIGNYVHIAVYCFLSGGEGIDLEDFSNLSQGVRLLTGSDDYSGRSMTAPTVPEKYKHVKKGPVRIGRHCIIGSGTVVLPGVRMGEGTAVGALSMVTESLAPWGVYAGAPVRRLKDRHRDLLEMEKKLLEEEQQ